MEQTSIAPHLAIVGVIAVSITAVGADAQTFSQSADCPGLGASSLPKKATFDNGFVLTILDRNGAIMRHETTSPDGRKGTVVTYKGLFTLSSENPLAKFE